MGKWGCFQIICHFYQYKDIIKIKRSRDKVQQSSCSRRDGGILKSFYISNHKVSLSVEAVRLAFRITRSFLNLVGVSAALLRSCYWRKIIEVINRCVDVAVTFIQLYHDVIWAFMRDLFSYHNVFSQPGCCVYLVLVLWEEFIEIVANIPIASFIIMDIGINNKVMENYAR